jgi:predicted transcriptional regulator
VLKRVKRGRAHVYQPIVSRDDVSNSVIRDLQTVLFGDRLPTLVLGLLENGRFSSDDVNALKAALKNVQSREGKP